MLQGHGSHWQPSSSTPSPCPLLVCSGPCWCRVSPAPCLFPAQVVAEEEEEEEEEEEVPGPWEEPEHPWKGSPRSGADPDGSGGQEPQEHPRSTREQQEEEEEEEEDEEEGSCCSEEGEDSSNVYLYYTLGERWIDYLQRTGDGGLLRHLRPKVTREPGSAVALQAPAGGQTGGCDAWLLGLGKEMLPQSPIQSPAQHGGPWS